MSLLLRRGSGVVSLVLLVIALTVVAASTRPASSAPAPWPGGSTVQTVDGTNVFGADLSGLAYEASGTSAPGVLWAVKNNPGSLHRLVWTGTVWVRDTANSWGAGKALRYPGGSGAPDAEGVTFAATSAGGIYIAAERNNSASSTSRNSILRYDPAAAGTVLTATSEWNLTANLPTVAANSGIEAITWVPDAYLVDKDFVDANTGVAYDPSDYADHAGGLFFVGLEANGSVYAYALNHTTGGFTRIATIVSGFAGVMALEFDRDREQLWAVCDNGCNGQSALLEVDANGSFAVTQVFDRPSGMGNLNNEGFAVAAEDECAGGTKPVYWSDDGNTSQHAIRRGTLDCPPPPVDTDGDGVTDDADNCDRAPNPTQLDTDGDLKGNACAADGLVPAECAAIAIDAVFIGTAAGETITGTPFNDLVLAKGGDDTVDAGEGDNCIDGGGGKDTLTALSGNDVIWGRAGANTIAAGNGSNRVFGGESADRITTGSGADEIVDAAGNNIVQSGGGGDTITTGAGKDTICTGVFTDFGVFATCTGGDADDTVDAGAGVNKVRTGAGADDITAGDDKDQIDCGQGVDTAHVGAGTNTNQGNRCETFVP